MAVVFEWLTDEETDRARELSMKMQALESGSINLLYPDALGILKDDMDFKLGLVEKYDPDVEQQWQVDPLHGAILYVAE